MILHLGHLDIFAGDVLFGGCIDDDGILDLAEAHIDGHSLLEVSRREHVSP